MPVIGARSRGLLLLHLADARSTRHLMSTVVDLDLSAYAPFTLLSLADGGASAVAEWSGSEKSVIHGAQARMPLVSSAFATDAVRTSRRNEFELVVADAGELSADALRAFHESHGCQPSAYSPCMHRPDASTVSFSWVQISAESIECFYTPEAPCQANLDETVTLKRSGYCL